MNYPIYRKLATGKTFYKITSDRFFEEKQVMGSKVFFHKIEAKQYPEMIRIQDMIHLVDGVFLE